MHEIINNEIDGNKILLRWVVPPSSEKVMEQRRFFGVPLEYAVCRCLSTAAGILIFGRYKDGWDYNASCRELVKHFMRQIDQLTEALYQHRHDLHGRSNRGCETCRKSAIALGIQDLVPGQCARVDYDKKAIKALNE